MLDQYRVACQGLGYAPATIRTRRYILQRINGPVLDATADELLRVISQPRSPASRRNYHNHLRSFWRDARMLGWTDRPWPLEGWRPPTPPDHAPRHFTPSEQRLLLGMPDPQMRAVTVVGLLAGLRVSEVMSLRSFDCDGARLWVQGKERDEYVPAHPRVVDALREWQPPVYSRPDKLSAAWRRHAAGVGVAGRFHSLRASFAQNLLDAGHDVTVVQRALRHRSITATMHYVRATDEVLSEAVASL